MTDTHTGELAAEALKLFNAGRLEAAGDKYRRLCALDSEDDESWFMLGLIDSASGALEQSIRNLTRAIELRPDHLGANICLAAVLSEHGQLDRAEALSLHATRLDPDCPEAWLLLASIQGATGRHGSAEAACQQVLDKNPAHPQAHCQLGMLRQAQGRYAEALQSLRKALELEPHLEQAQQALAETHAGMAATHQSNGDHAGALEACLQGLRLDKDNLQLRRLFIRLLHKLPAVEPSSELLHEIDRCFSSGGLDLQQLNRPIIALMAREPLFGEMMSLAQQGDLQTLGAHVKTGRYANLLRDKLFNQALTQTLFCDASFETLLRSLRSIYLHAMMAQQSEPISTGAQGDDLGFHVSLACQCFISEYSYALDSKEASTLQGIKTDLEAALSEPRWNEQIHLAPLLVFCMYEPLYRLAGAESLLNSVSHAHAVLLEPLIRMQWREPQEERLIRPAIPAITAIDDAVSHKVRGQYEAAPYPRWLTVAQYSPEPRAEVLRRMFPASSPPNFGDGPIDILIAGCGTGKQAIMSVSRFANSRALAVDLSLTSLAYAKRKADELGLLDNISFAQADILKLGSLGKRFHIVESVGVLHHLEYPKQGLAVLTDLVHESGLINLGLYSLQARRHIIEVQNYVRECEFPATEAGIRQARKEIMASDKEAFRHVTRLNDFYSLSGCRDLLFHIQEKCYRLPELASMLADADLRFLGFRWDNQDIPARYRRQNPDDPAMTDLGKWDAFENQYPDTFIGMYVFWCQKV